MEQANKQSIYTVNRDALGHVRIWEYSPEKGLGKLLLEQKNLITKQGADITAKALSGLPNTGITHMYVEYNTTGTQPTPTISDTPSSFGTVTRKALVFAPSFANESGYMSNLVYFTTYLTGTDVPNGDKIVSLGLINATNPSSNLGDNLFSRVAFAPITYDSSHGLAITWGVTFRAS